MQKKFYRVELKSFETNRIFDTNERNYGNTFNFLPYQHFINSYAQVMATNNMSMDFLVTVNNQIYTQGIDFLKVLENAIVNKEHIDLYKVTKNPYHKNQTISVKSFNQFLQSFDQTNQFMFLDDGTYLWEFISEYVRINFFSEKPKRLTSIFLFDDLNNCEYYIKTHLNGIGKIYEVELLKTEAFFEGDMGIIDQLKNHMLYEDVINEMADYWRGKMSSKPIKEIIFQGTYQYKGTLAFNW